MKRLIEVTKEFQSERKGVHEHNDVFTSIRRAEMEIQEAWEEFYIGSPEALKKELIDVALFIAAALVALQVDEREAETLVMEKHRMNQKRYDTAYFDRVGLLIAGKEYSVSDALSDAKRNDKQPAWEGSDYY